MRMKTIRGLLKAARWIQRAIDVRLPMDALNGLRTRQEFSDVYKHK